MRFYKTILSLPRDQDRRDTFIQWGILVGFYLLALRCVFDVIEFPIIAVPVPELPNIVLPDWSITEWASVATVFALIANVYVIWQGREELKLDRKERKEARVYQAWEGITNSRVSGARKMQYLEWLNEQGESLQQLVIDAGTHLYRSAEDGDTLGLKLRNADLSDAIFKGVVFTESVFKDANLFCTNFEDAELHSTNFEDADLTLAKLKGAFLQESNFKFACLTLANFEGASLYEVDFADIDSIGTNFQGAHLSEANFQGAHLSRANFQGAHLSEANFQGAYLSKANFQGALLDAVDFTATLDLTNKQVESAYYIDALPILPDGITAKPQQIDIQDWREEHQEFLERLKKNKKEE